MAQEKRQRTPETKAEKALRHREYDVLTAIFMIANYAIDVSVVVRNPNFKTAKGCGIFDQ